MNKAKLLRYTAVSDTAITFNTKTEWLNAKENLQGRSPNAILVRNISDIDPVTGAGNRLRVQGSLIQAQTEILFKCDDAGGVWNINEFHIGFPDSDTETPFEFITIIHTGFYYTHIEIRDN